MHKPLGKYTLNEIANVCHKIWKEVDVSHGCIYACPFGRVCTKIFVDDDENEKTVAEIRADCKDFEEVIDTWGY